MTLSAAEGAGGRRCLIAGDGTDSCKTPAEVGRGWSMDVSNDCSKLDGAMNVRGMVPAQVGTVRLIGGDGTTHDTTVANGVFNYDMPRHGLAMPALP
jgi:predicted polyphosphate/ATP-dependent NAD kinase